MNLNGLIRLLDAGGGQRYAEIELRNNALVMQSHHGAKVNNVLSAGAALVVSRGALPNQVSHTPVEQRHF